MKKTAILLTLVLIALPIVLAEEGNTSAVNETVIPENNTLSNETTNNMDNNSFINSSINTQNETQEIESELAAATTPYGLTVRLLQLERQINIKVEQGSKIVDLVEQNSTLNASDLRAIISELEQVKIDVSNLANSTINNVSDTTQTFVDLRHQAAELVNKFKLTARLILKEYNLEQIRTNLASINESSFGGLNQRINDLKKLHNAVVMQGVLTYTGIKDSSLVQGLLNGTINYTKAVKTLRDDYNSLNESDKEQFRFKVGQNITKTKIRITSTVEKAVQHAQDNYNNWLNEHNMTNISGVLNRIRNNRGGDR